MVNGTNFVASNSDSMGSVLENLAEYFGLGVVQLKTSNERIKFEDISGKIEIKGA